MLKTYISWQIDINVMPEIARRRDQESKDKEMKSRQARNIGRCKIYESKQWRESKERKSVRFGDATQFPYANKAIGGKRRTRLSQPFITAVGYEPPYV